MTSTTDDFGVQPARQTLADPVRRILAIDAGVAATTGTALLVAATPIAEQADLAAPTVVRAIGAFLLLLGIDLALLARGAQRWARIGAAVTAAGDVGWVVGSVVLAATAGLPTLATVAVLAQALVILAIAGAKRAALAPKAP